MKKLQNNFTTPEQSKRLLELGVPADSADCVNYISPTCDGGVYVSTDAIQIPHGSTFSGYSCSETYPIWSVGRLMEIYGICMGVEGFFYCKGNFINEAIRRIEGSVKNNLMDFSKLEE